MAMTNAMDDLNTMTDRELVAYWNILQYPFHTTAKDESHRCILEVLMDRRGIPHERGKQTAAAGA